MSWRRRRRQPRVSWPRASWRQPPAQKKNEKVAEVLIYFVLRVYLVHIKQMRGWQKYWSKDVVKRRQMLRATNGTERGHRYDRGRGDCRGDRADHRRRDPPRWFVRHRAGCASCCTPSRFRAISCAINKGASSSPTHPVPVRISVPWLWFTPALPRIQPRR